MTTVEEREYLIARGHRAKALLQNDMFEKTCSDIQNDMFAQFIAAGHDEGEFRDGLWAISNAVIEINRILQGYADVGRVEQENKKYDEPG